MTFHPSSEIGSSRQLSDGWTMCLTSAGEWKKPSDKTAISINVPAIVPGTVAAALERAGQFQREQSLDLDQKDAWYSRVLNEPAGNATLHFEGLATYTEIYLNDMLVLSTDSMFQPYSVDIELTGEDRLDLCFRALGPILSGKQPRARWRPQMIVPPAIRMIRTTLLGRMPGWCPEIHAVGPYRPIILQRKSAGLFYDVNIASSLDASGTGLLIATVRSQRSLSGYEVHCASSSALLTELETGVWTAKLSLPNVKCWWPQTHGEPVLHHIDLVSPSGDAIAMGRTGFRHVEIDRGLDGSDFALKINGVTVFCRGAVWTNADIVSLPGDRCDYEPWLKLAAQAGFNMIRIGGTMTYETAAFLSYAMNLASWSGKMLCSPILIIRQATSILSPKLKPKSARFCREQLLPRLLWCFVAAVKSINRQPCWVCQRRCGPDPLQNRYCLQLFLRLPLNWPMFRTRLRAVPCRFRRILA